MEKVRNCKNCNIEIEGKNRYCEDCSILYSTFNDKIKKQNSNIQGRILDGKCARCDTQLTETMKMVHHVYCSSYCADSWDFLE